MDMKRTRRSLAVDGHDLVVSVSVLLKAFPKLN
jgi:hypothetical protein